MTTMRKDEYGPGTVYVYKDVYKIRRDDAWDIIKVTKKLRHVPIGTCSSEQNADALIEYERSKE